MKTRVYGAEFKQAAVEELLGGRKRVSQICREREIDVTTLRCWRIEFKERGATLPLSTRYGLLGTFDAAR